MLKVIGAGHGRTGAYSLKLALEQLGLGPCHHMEKVLEDSGAANSAVERGGARAGGLGHHLRGLRLGRRLADSRLLARAGRGPPRGRRSF